MTRDQLREAVARAIFEERYRHAGFQAWYVGTQQDKWRDYLDVADAALAAMTPQWLDIKSAPKDGTAIDVWTGNAEHPQRFTDVSWREPTDSEYWANGSDDPKASEGTFGPEPGWFDCLGFKLHGDQEPTNWMPLPAAPRRRND